jgi:ABC-type branched-subunit amino acid transport system substrate-binding protein
MGMPRDVQRRDVLKGVGVAGISVGLAGCNGNGNGDDTATDGGNGNMTEGDGDGDMGMQARVGVLLPETGDLGSLGTTIRDGALLASSQVNDADVGVSVDTQVEDTQTTPQAGVSGAEGLVNAGYPAVVGSASSNVNLTITREVLIPNEVVGMSPSSTAPAVTDLEDDDYIFRTAPSDVLQGQALGLVAEDNVGASSTATLFLNDAYGQALEQQYVNECEERSIEVTNRVSLEPEQSSYSAQWQDTLDGDPDAVMVVAFPASGIQLFSDYYNDFAGDETIIVPDGLVDDDLPTEVDNDFENVIGTGPGAAGPGVEFFNESYQEEFGSSAQVFNAQAYDAMATFILAQVAAGGDADGTAVRDNIRPVTEGDGTEVGPSELADGIETLMNDESINYQGASTRVEFDDNGDPPDSAPYDLSEYDPSAGDDGLWVAFDSVSF